MNKGGHIAIRIRTKALVLADSVTLLLCPHLRGFIARWILPGLVFHSPEHVINIIATSKHPNTSSYCSYMLINYFAATAKGDM